MRLLITILLSFIVNLNFSQTNSISDVTEISIITIGPGNSLADKFGHSGIRIKDDNKDLFFNYGVYDFTKPNFYLNFTLGKLEYKLDVGNFNDVLNYYKLQNRDVKEQVLNLSYEDKYKIWSFLLNNYKPENQFYLYDFFYDNCATRIIDVLEKSTNKTFDFSRSNDKSFRQLVNSKLNWNTWKNLGTDIALGGVTDLKASKKDLLFLPDNIYSVINEDATLDNNKLLRKQSILYKSKNESKNILLRILLSPLFILSLISGLLIYIAFFKNEKALLTVTSALLMVTGVLGVFLTFLWFFTDHTATWSNYNVLWANPLNLIALTFIKTQKVWVKNYFKFNLLLIVLLFIHWTTGVQAFSFCLIPFLIGLSLMYLRILNNK